MRSAFPSTSCSSFFNCANCSRTIASTLPRSPFHTIRFTTAGDDAWGPHVSAKYTTLHSAVTARIVQVARGLCVPNASEATGMNPSSITKLGSQIASRATSSTRSESRPRAVTSGRPLWT
jgi:hypothetical protein